MSCTKGPTEVSVHGYLQCVGLQLVNGVEHHEFLGVLQSKATIRLLAATCNLIPVLPPPREAKNPSDIDCR